MKKNSKKRNFGTPQLFVVDVGIFKIDVVVAVNLSEAEIIKWFKKATIKKVNEEIAKKIEGWDKESAGNCEGRMAEIQGGYIVLLKLSKNAFRVSVGRIVHEMVHVAQFIFKSRRTGHCEDTEELEAYLIEYLVTQTLFKLYK